MIALRPGDFKCDRHQSRASRASCLAFSRHPHPFEGAQKILIAVIFASEPGRAAAQNLGDKETVASGPIPTRGSGHSAPQPPGATPTDRAKLAASPAACPF